MYFTAHNQVARSKEMTTVFGGYNHRLSCQDGEFFNMQNMTTAYYPMLSPRNKRGVCRKLTAPKCLVDNDGLIWIDDNVLYENGAEAKGDVAANELEKTDYFVKMGAEIVGFPSMVSYNTETKEVDYLSERFFWGSVDYISQASADGTEITWKRASVYADTEPEDGVYAMFTENGKDILKQWSKAQGMWVRVKSSYVQFQVGSSELLEKYVGSEVKVSVNNCDGAFDTLLDIFTTEEEDDWYSTTTTLVGLIENPNYYAGATGVTKYIGMVFEGVVEEAVKIDGLLGATRFIIDPLNPVVSHAVECNNRIWGCSEDGHEIYASALGDWKRWKCYQGIATDSYAVTIGSSGKFTGAVTYQGNPIFFKENTMIKVTVSSTGAHQVREINCPGVENGSEKSLCVINGVLYYKGVEGIYAYDGSLPVLISSPLGEVRYHKAVAGTILDRYYVSMKDGNGASHLFVYDTGTGMWAKEDSTDVKEFCRSGDDLYYIDNADNTLKSIRGTLLYEEGTTEGEIDWCAESGNVGYYLPNKKHLAKLQIRLSMELGTNVCIYLQYDSSGNWEHICNLSGTGTRSFVVPVIPRRCDHFKYKIAGRGGCKIFSVTKTIEEGSDL
ncbi:MAG: hypothetical protein J6K15_06320 [Lachnospiraceae bacterium]|nr:hypothetical protein [Lachnospiraceae bacterium]